MFSLLDEIEKREKRIAENEANKQVVVELEKQLADAKAKVCDDEQIRAYGVEIEQIKEICYQVGVLDRPVAAEVADAEVVAVEKFNLVKPAGEEE